MGTTICYDILINEAKMTKLKSKAEPGQEDKELQDKVEKYKERYQNQADQIYNVQEAKISAESTARKLSIDAMSVVKEAEYTLERFNSTDTEKYSEDEIKTSLSKELKKLMAGDEYQEELRKKREEQKKKDDEKQKAKKANQITEKKKAAAEKLKKKQEERKKRDEKRKKENNARIDLISAASEIGKSTDKAIDELKASVNKSLDEYEESVNFKAKENGEAKGAKMVEAYNKPIRQSARTIFDNNKKTIAKAQIKLDAAKQKAKLKLGALLGL